VDNVVAGLFLGAFLGILAYTVGWMAVDCLITLRRRITYLRIRNEARRKLDRLFKEQP